MFRSLLLRLAATSAVLAGTAAQGSPRPPAETHRPSQPAPASLLPDAAPMANAAAALGHVYGGTPIDVLTYHYDRGRTGWNQSETDLTPAAVASAKFGLLTTLQVDGNVFAQPLLVSGYPMPDGSTHDVLIVATGHNSVFAYDARDYQLLWQRSLGVPQSSNDVGCGDVQPEYGISSTPVILRSARGTATIYLVAATEPKPFSFHSTLHALDVGTGRDVATPAELAPSATLAGGGTVSFDPQNQWNRAGLATDGASIYVGIGSHCDNNSGSITGWLLRYNAVLAPLGAFNTIQTSRAGGELASIWMTGFAPALDPLGNLFVVTGNGGVAGRDWGESALSLDPSVTHVRSRFTPASYPTLNDNDQDFGSGGIMLLPVVPKQTVPPLAVALGKSAILYLLDQNRLGGLKPNDTGALQATTLTNRGNAGLWGGPAYYNGANNGPTVFLQTDSDVLRGFSVATTGTPALTQMLAGTTKAGYGGSLPIVSSNGDIPGSGVVWLVRRSVPMELEAYDADMLGAPLFTARAGVWSNTQNQNSFVTPMQANGRVYAPAYKTVKVFGLAP